MTPPPRSRSARRPAVATLACALALTGGCSFPGLSGGARDADWPVATGGDPGNTRYSALAQIDHSNVARLQVAWTYHANGGVPRGQIQNTPIVVDGVLYGAGAGRVFALRGDTGEQIWSFAPPPSGPAAAGGQPQDPLGVIRGVVYWSDGAADRRILFHADRRLWALGAATGRPVPSFGENGSADFTAGLGPVTPAQQLTATSPGIVFEELLIHGSRVSEGEGALPGHIRAFDVRTGALRWLFRTIPQPGEPGHESWPPGAERYIGGANSWAGLTLDRERGIVYAPTGSPSPDFWGGNRVGANLYGNSLLALDARTGRRIWHFQAVHHDIWDRDLPAAPNLLTVRRGGREIDAVAQISKQAFIFVFDRETGEPLFPIEERPVPASPLEWTAPTQPFPVAPAPFARQSITEADLTDISPEARAAVLARFRTLRAPTSVFEPGSVEGTILIPGYDGGGEWGGAAVDPGRGILYVNSSDVPWILRLVPTDTAPPAAPRTGQAVYERSCAACHRPDRGGDGDRTPSLVGIGERLTATQIRQVIDQGRGFMPSFAHLPEAERSAVTAYLLGRDAAVPGAPAASEPRSAGAPAPAPYRFGGYERWRDPNGLPAIRPPWGTLSAVDLNTGEYLWRIPLGHHPGVPRGNGPPTGTELYGGPIVTAGGLVFVASTMDEMMRAIDRETGEVLWEAKLPAAGYATPMTYMVNGKQYVVIAAGGGKLGTPTSDAFVAFALPD